MLSRPSYPSKPIQKVIPYPDELKNKCPICHFSVEFKYNSAEKTIYTLKRSFDVRYHLVVCTNKKCLLYKHPFNPSPRFDYSQRSYGKDVLEKIGDYYINEGSNSRQIYGILKKEYDLPISKSTVARITNDILILTSFNIDANTEKIMKNQKFILLALDGQEPDGDHPALWNFVDVLSSRVLHTRYLESVDNEILHEIIEEIKKKYDKPIIGFISDKQGSIRLCMERFYPEIPHQYCTYHFSTNQWNHLEKFTNKIHNDLKKTAKRLYISTVSKKATINVPDEDEKISIKALCSPLAKEIQKVVSTKNEKFKNLRGISSYEALSQYLEGFKRMVAQIPVRDRFAKIMHKTIDKLSSCLERNQDAYEKAKEGFDYFREIHKILWKEETSREEKIERLDNVYNTIWERVKEIEPNFSHKDRKSFLPSSTTPYWKFLGEWTRLWERYKPGLFKYYDFPEIIKSNVDMEQKFSSETHRFRSQSGRSHIGRMIESRGEYVIRLQYATLEDFNFDAIISNSKGHLKYLQAELNEKIHNISARAKNCTTINQKYTHLLSRMYEWQMTKKEEGLR